MKKRVADIVVETLIENGIDKAFSVVGGGAMHLNNAFALKRDSLKTVYNHHEQASAMAAEAYARLTGNLAAVCVTSGPGGLNTLNGVQGAWVDSLPMIVIAGHPRYETTVEASGLDVRCIGVQENDIIPQVKNITKYAKMITDPKAVKKEVQHAIDCAMDGRRGPVWISVPLDVQGAQVEEEELYPTEGLKSELSLPQDNDIKEVIDKMKHAERACILTGSGIRSGAAIEGYRVFREKVDIPIVGGFGAPDVNYKGENGYYGMSGSIGSRGGNLILRNSDFILVLGNSLSSSQTGFNVEEFAKDATVYMVDAQADEAKKKGLHVDKLICCDIKAFFDKFNHFSETVTASNEWKSYCNMIHDGIHEFEVLDLVKDTLDMPVHPARFWKEFLEKAENNAIFALGNSSCNQPILSEGISKRAQRVLINYHSGSMGTDIPFAIGAAEGADGRPIYCISGDGCFMMNLQELQTIKYNEYPIKIVLFNNNGYDNIRMTCRNYFNGLGNGCDSESGLDMPDFKKVAEAFSYKYYKVDTNGDLTSGIDWIIAQNEPCMLEITEKQDKERAPLVKSAMDENGKFTTPPIHVMSPLLAEDVLKKYTKYVNR